MKIFQKAVLVGLALGVASAAGCSSSAPTSPSGTAGTVAAPGTGQTGTVEMNLQLGPSITISSIQYVITNPTLAGFATITASVDVTNSQEIGFSLTLPVATGYTLSLAATDSAGDSCSGGPVTFQVIANESSAVGLTLLCTRTVEAGLVGPDVGVGTVSVTADASIQTTTTQSPCAAASSITAQPNRANVGFSVDLTAAGLDPSYQSSDVTLTWAATGGAGTLTGTSGTTNTFLCQSAGSETITVTAAISGGGASCPSTGTLSTTVSCDTVGDATVEAGASPVDAAAETSAPQGGNDASSADTGASVPDTGTGTEEASAGEAGAGEAGAGDGAAGSSEAGTEAGTTAALAPCTTAGQANCVTCQGNATGTGANGGICTATEALFVQKDITAGIATAAGPDPSTGCYSCLLHADCLDDDEFGDTDQECGDPLSTGTSAECLTTVSCLLSSGCAASSPSICYCGTAPTTTTCYSTPSAENGACATQIATGNGFAVDDGADNLTNLTNTTLASGMAVQIFECGKSNHCSQCSN